MIGVMLVVAFMAPRLRFGRAIYALGGNPEAAELAGINTRWTIMKTFILLGLLCGFAGAIASARLNGASLDIGSATNCSSLPRRSSAGRRSRVASARFRGRSSGRW